MTMQEIKADIARLTGKTQPTLMMVRQMVEGTDDEPTEWLSHWDNENRIRVSMHQNVLEHAKTGPADLSYKHQLVPAKTDPTDPNKVIREGYTRFVIITPLHVEATF